MLEYAAPDVLCLQETKLADKAFPSMTFGALGYDSVHYGQGQWNGVAILSRVGIETVTSGFGELDDPYEGDARLIAATCGGVHVVSVYVPNGREVATEHYERKLAWLAQLRGGSRPPHPPTTRWRCSATSTWLPRTTTCGARSRRSTGRRTSPRTRSRRAPPRVGHGRWIPSPRHDDDRLFTYWDYRRGDFHQHRGMRIDLVLVTQPLADRLEWALVDRNTRKGQQPSDHAPVFVDIADA